MAPTTGFAQYRTFGDDARRRRDATRGRRRRRRTRESARVRVVVVVESGDAIGARVVGDARVDETDDESTGGDDDDD
jgi:hypothetical protein